MTHHAALLIIDMLNDLAFDGGGALVAPGLAAAHRIVELRSAAREAGVPVIYVNDNYGHWRAERRQLIDYVTRADAPGRPIAELVLPSKDDLLIVKPRFSGFYASNLAVLLPQLKATRLILTGMATDICVLFTAADAHMREYDLWVPEDAVASEDARRNRWALDIMRNSMNAETRPTAELPLKEWLETKAST